MGHFRIINILQGSFPISVKMPNSSLPVHKTFKLDRQMGYITLSQNNAGKSKAEISTSPPTNAMASPTCPSPLVPQRAHKLVIFTARPWQNSSKFLLRLTAGLWYQNAHRPLVGGTTWGDKAKKKAPSHLLQVLHVIDSCSSTLNGTACSLPLLYMLFLWTPPIEIIMTVWIQSSKPISWK